MKKDLVDILIENVGVGVLAPTLFIGLVGMLALLFFGEEIINKLAQLVG